MIRITNDTTTLNGALSELGETMATNITTKGVSASASDGLTTLAGKILQISGGGGGTTTYIDDKGNSSSGLSNYGSLHQLRISSGPNGTLSYDSTMNAYKFTTTSANNDGFVDFPITALDNKDNYYVEAEFYTTDTSTGGQSGIVLYPSTDTGGNGVFFRDIASINRCGVLKFANYSENGESGNSQQSSLPVGNNWYKLRLEVEGNDVTAKWQQTNGTTVYSTSYTLPYTSGAMRVGLAFLAKYTIYPYYIRNIKAESLGGGSDCSQYQTQINNAIEYINGSGS